MGLNNEDLALERVAQRVAQGGHYIPEATIKRRYLQGLKNMIRHYLPLVDNAIILDNSNIELQTMIASKNSKNGLIIDDHIIWEKIERLINE